MSKQDMLCRNAIKFSSRLFHIMGHQCHHLEGHPCQIRHKQDRGQGFNFHPRLLHCQVQLLAVMVLNQHWVLLSKTVGLMLHVVPN